MIKISVITITYNAEHVINRTMESVLSQTYPHVEHLIIDGASGDKTLSMAYAYKMKSDGLNNGHEVLLTSEPDEGIYDAMNKGLKQATGDYVVFLNAGDRFHDSDVLKHIADIASKVQRPAVIYGHTDIVDDNGSFICHRRLSPPKNLTWRSFKYGMLRRLVHTDHERSRETIDAYCQCKRYPNRLSARRTNHVAPSRVAKRKIQSDAPTLRSSDHLCHALLVCLPLHQIILSFHIQTFFQQENNQHAPRTALHYRASEKFCIAP